MGLSVQIKTSISTELRKTVPFHQKESHKELKFTISCRADKSTVAMENGKAINFYEVLSLDCSKTICLDEIKKAYRYKALKFHPDACPPSLKEESTRRFIEIRMAYETLCDPISRKMHDQELSLVDAEGRRSRHGNGMSCCMDNKRGTAEEFPREVWERQLRELKNRSRKKWQYRIHETI